MADGIRQDPALEWFRQDAEAQGIGLADYLRRYGILTEHQERMIRAREVPLEGDPEG